MIVLKILSFIYHFEIVETAAIKNALNSNEIRLGETKWKEKYLFNCRSTENYDAEKTLTFIVDGEIVEVYKILPNASAEKIQVDLNYGLSLKIMSKGFGVGLGNITFLG